jgi:hypothetical protein
MAENQNLIDSGCNCPQPVGGKKSPTIGGGKETDNEGNFRT